MGKENLGSALVIISHTHKFIFIKSFKTAGTSVESILSTHCSGEDIVTPLNDYHHNRDEKGQLIHKSMNAEEYIRLNLPNLQHVDALTIKTRVPPEVWVSYFKISIARNPWDRAVSSFYWEKRNDPMLNPKKKFYNYLGVPFDELGHLRKLFSAFVKTDQSPNNDRFYTIDDQLCVDYVIRYETLPEDYRKLCRRLGLPIIDLPRLKGGVRKGRYHYSDYYDEETKDIVAKKHKNDIRLFQYKFKDV